MNEKENRDKKEQTNLNLNIILGDTYQVDISGVNIGDIAATLEMEKAEAVKRSSSHYSFEFARLNEK
ncbi:hypothetical protein LCGC14_0735460 [marine sediment metagenome]|uniref:Uncharacterized protein n=1 Tax=marine sediment metagenome TaxID=412755 RepID=A0A0F9QCI4_9ZZZZ